jgi:ribonuclease P protein component
MGETNLPTQHPEAGQATRVPAPDVHARRAGHPQGQAAEGPPQAVGLIHRISDAATFTALRRSRRRARRGPITVTFVPDARTGPPRVAYAIGRSVGGAVVRNRLRRRMRAVVSELGPHLRPGAYLVGAAPEAASLPFGALQEMVTGALDDAGRGARR